MTFNFENIFWMVRGVLGCFMLTVLFAVIFVLLSKIGKTKEKKDNKREWSWLICLISIDYYLAKAKKKLLIDDDSSKNSNGNNSQCDDENNKNTADLRARLIEQSNIFNLIFSLVLAVVAFIAVCVKCNVFTYIMFGVLCYRILSRTLEINISFVIDICDKVKSSSLSNEKRVKLAIKSLLEEAFLFAAMYAFLISGECNFWQVLSGGLHSFTIDVYEVVSERLWCSDLFNAVAVWQKVCSGILVTLCIVQYFASKDSNVDSGKTN